MAVVMCMRLLSRPPLRCRSTSKTCTTQRNAASAREAPVLHRILALHPTCHKPLRQGTHVQVFAFYPFEKNTMNTLRASGAPTQTTLKTSRVPSMLPGCHSMSKSRRTAASSLATLEDSRGRFLVRNQTRKWCKM